MIARIPAALLPLLSPLSVRVGQPDSGVMIPIRTGKRVLHFDAGARAAYLGMSAHDAGGAVCVGGGVGVFFIDPDRLYVDTLSPAARDMLCRAIADHLGVPGDGPAATVRTPEGWWIERFSPLLDPASAPLPIPIDTPGAEVIGRAMAALWGAE